MLTFNYTKFELQFNRVNNNKSSVFVIDQHNDCLQYMNHLMNILIVDNKIDIVSLDENNNRRITIKIRFDCIIDKDDDIDYIFDTNEYYDRVKGKIIKDNRFHVIVVTDNEHRYIHKCSLLHAKNIIADYLDV